MNTKTFKKYLSVYGTNIENWPKEIRSEVGSIIESNNEYKALLEQERSFEGFLNLRSDPEPDSLLTDRIIQKALATSTNYIVNFDNEKKSFIKDLLPNFNFKSALAVSTLILALGIGLGYYTKLNSSSLYQQEASVDTDVQIEDVIFYEGEIL